MLMFAIEVPRKGPYVFGLINDITGGIYNLAVIPLVRRLGTTDDGPGWQLLTKATVTSGVAGAASSFLLVARILPFAPSTVISTLAITVQSAWMFVFGARGPMSRVLPPAVRRLAQLIGMGTFVGLPVAGIGALLPKKSLPRQVTLGLGVAAGATGWVAVPVFWLLVARAYGTRGSLSR
jgi:hypothetical protein